MKMQHEFVEYVPAELKQRVVYISIPFATVTHLCACGCGHEVVTPLSPADWRLTFDGESVSLEPSVGNWGLACRSHYWIKRGAVHWAEQWSDKRVRHSRSMRSRAAPSPTATDQRLEGHEQGRSPIWKRLLERLFSR